MLLLFWFCYVFLFLASFECNLRAILTKANYEEEIDDEFDLLRAGRSLFLPAGTHYPGLLRSSPRPVQRR